MESGAEGTLWLVTHIARDQWAGAGGSAGTMWPETGLTVVGMRDGVHTIVRQRTHENEIAVTMFDTIPRGNEAKRDPAPQTQQKP